jgi:hypothetical protein
LREGDLRRKSNSEERSVWIDEIDGGIDCRRQMRELEEQM